MLHDDSDWQSWAKYFSKLPQFPSPFIHESAISWAGKLVALKFDFVAQCTNLALAIFLPCDVKVHQTHDMRVLYLVDFLSTFCGHCSSWVFVNGSSWPGWINTLLWHCHTVLCVLYLVSFFYIYSCAKIKIIKRQLIQFYKFDWTRVLFPLFQKKAYLNKSVMYCIKCISETPRSVVLRPAWTSLWSDSEICRLHRIVNLVSCENKTLRQDKWPPDKKTLLDWRHSQMSASVV